MATSLRDLLSAVEADVRGGARAVPRETADDAALSLGEAARALERLRIDGLDREVGGVRELAVREVEIACRAAGAAWRGLPSARFGDLMAIAADLAGRRRAAVSRDERWAAAIAIADAARRLARHAQSHQPYAGAPQLTRVHHTSVTVARLGAQQPPSVQGRAVLDRAVPVGGLPAGLRGSRVATESCLALVHELDHREARNCPLRLCEVLVVMRVAEEAARYAIDSSSPVHPDRAAGPWRSAPVAWRASREALKPFDDGTRRRPENTAVVLWAVRLHEGLKAEFRPDRVTHSLGERGSDAATALQVIANHLPQLAEDLTRATRHWARSGSLTTRATAVRFRADRVDAWLRQDAVRADAEDLHAVARSLRSAWLLSVDLAAELSRESTNGRQPQPFLAAAHVARIGTPKASAELARRARSLACEPSVEAAPVAQTTNRRGIGLGAR